MTLAIRECRRCGKGKPASDFYPHDAWCRQCRIALRSERQSKDYQAIVRVPVPGWGCRVPAEAMFHGKPITDEQRTLIDEIDAEIQRDRIGRRKSIKQRRRPNPAVLNAKLRAANEPAG